MAGTREDHPHLPAGREPGQGGAVRYRTTPLKGLFAHAKGGFWHDGRFPNLDAVVQHYDSCFGLGLTGQQQADLVQYLKGL